MAKRKHPRLKDLRQGQTIYIINTRPIYSNGSVIWIGPPEVKNVRITTPRIQFIGEMPKSWNPCFYSRKRAETYCKKLIRQNIIDDLIALKRRAEKYEAEQHNTEGKYHEKISI